jgi:hypothetical protein
MAAPVLHVFLLTIAAAFGLKLETDRMATQTTISQENRSRATLVFIAGLEGSGHHLLLSFLDHIKTTPAEGWAFLSELPSQWQQGGKSRKEPDYSEIVNRWANLPEGTIEFIGLWPPISYPAWTGSHWDRMHFQYPRLDWIQDAAHEANVNLRVIFAHRALDACLAANCLHREFETCPLQVETMKWNARHLASHLNAIPSSELQCFTYGNPDSMLKSLQDVLGVEQVPQNIVDLVYVENPPDNLRDNEEHWDDLVKSLGGAQTTLDNICTRSRRTSMKDMVESFRLAA